MPKPKANKTPASLKVARRVLTLESEAIRQLKRQLNHSFDDAVQLLLRCLQQRGKIIVTGVGKSALIGHKIAATLSSTGSPAVVLDSTNALHGDIGLIAEGDVALLLSYSGETEELVRILPVLKHLSTPIIAITRSTHSTLGKHADITLRCEVSKEACPLNLAPTASTAAMLSLGDALAMALLEARGFKREDFARYHPAGSLGKQLLQIRHVMRSRDKMTILDEKTPITTAMKAMAEARTGAVIVTDSRGRVTGIYTQGDFTRTFVRDPSIIQRGTLKEVMTRRPITVPVDKLAVEVLALFREHDIDDLIVVDAQHRPVGLIDAQDLAKHRLV
ncbi:MAG: KpsF/GutQ family sugar-phosphate isomerase [Methylacidiphilales bacterium]|nr:KpsF/GutQ family sugar-phosphate isomerase [Candidatus Methylacidiphilales bacterium]MDW8349497.1 KpsF/GutQ family sugar-phosphate isomerase [Verrucomicrobiae bacterium]